RMPPPWLSTLYLPDALPISEPGQVPVRRDHFRPRPARRGPAAGAAGLQRAGGAPAAPGRLPGPHGHHQGPLPVLRHHHPQPDAALQLRRRRHHLPDGAGTVRDPHPQHRPAGGRPHGPAPDPPAGRSGLGPGGPLGAPADDAVRPREPAAPAPAPGDRRRPPPLRRAGPGARPAAARPAAAPVPRLTLAGLVYTAFTEGPGRRVVPPQPSKSGGAPRGMSPAAGGLPGGFERP